MCKFNGGINVDQKLARLLRLMNSLYGTSASLAPAVPDQGLMPTTNRCTSQGLYKYQTELNEWTVCQACARQGWGTKRDGLGKLVCDTSAQKPAALLACQQTPLNPCYPMARPRVLTPGGPWEARHSWGASVYDPVYQTFILYGTWDDEKGRPYFAAEAPYMRAGQGGCGPTQ